MNVTTSTPSTTSNVWMARRIRKTRIFVSYLPRDEYQTPNKCASCRRGRNALRNSRLHHFDHFVKYQSWGLIIRPGSCGSTPCKFDFAKVIWKSGFGCQMTGKFLAT